VLSEVDFGFGGSDLGQDNPSDVSTIGVKVRIYTLPRPACRSKSMPNSGTRSHHSQPAIHVDRPDMGRLQLPRSRRPTVSRPPPRDPPVSCGMYPAFGYSSHASEGFRVMTVTSIFQSSKRTMRSIERKPPRERDAPGAGGYCTRFRRFPTAQLHVFWVSIRLFHHLGAWRKTPTELKRTCASLLGSLLAV